MIHLVGGFLGSGKTTAILSAARLLISRGLRVGIVTNDQGRYLVDTAFARALGHPAVEVTGGCFCCNYDDFNRIVSDLERKERPDVIFAESVGSCADVVATVVAPLLEMNVHAAGSFSVLSDIRLAARFLSGKPLPFSEPVTYLFGQQLAEAGILLLNKADLLPEEEASAVLALARERYPRANVRLHSSFREQDVADWIEETGRQGALPSGRLDIDYQEYGRAEAALAWYDARLRFAFPEGRGGTAVGSFLNRLESALTAEGAPIGHLKALVSHSGGDEKISLTGGDETGLMYVRKIPGTSAEVVLNARVQMGAERLREIVRAAAAEVGGVTFLAEDSFHPAQPTKPAGRVYPPAPPTKPAGRT